MPPDSTPRNAVSVVGPAHCEDHRTHRIGCLNCAADECDARTDLDLVGFLAHMEQIGWPEGNLL